ARWLCPWVDADARRLPWVVRSADERTCRHHHPRRAAVRSDRGRDPRQRGEGAALLDGRARRDCARSVQPASQRRDRHFRRPAGRLRRAPQCAGDRSRAAGGVGFRVRVPDGVDESAAQRQDRDRVHDAGRAVHLHQLAADQGSLRARRSRARPGAGARRTPPARERSGQESMKLADRTTRIASSPTMKVTATVDRLRRSGVEVIDFGAGEPDFSTPGPVKAAGHAALDADFTRYTPVPGIADLRRAIGARYKADYGVEYSEAETIVTAGGKQALYN